MEKSNKNSDSSFNNINNLSGRQISELSSNMSPMIGANALGKISQLDGSGSYSKPIKIG